MGHSAQDADSDGSEGAYYALRPEEVLAVLGEDQGTAFNACYDITEEGNFHGFSIPNLLHSPLPGDRFAACIPALYAYRLARASLHRDDKVLAGWNGLLMGALSWLYRVSGQTIYRDAARGIWTYLSRVHGSQGTLSATSRDGLARGIGVFRGLRILRLWPAVPLRSHPGAVLSVPSADPVPAGPH